jgi:Uma2 family endonuclease
MVAGIPLIQERRYTVEEFRQICQLPENDTKCLELIDGVIVEMSSSSKRNTIIAGLIIYYLNAFVIPRGIGFVSVSDGGYHLGDGNIRQPDVAFITKARSEGLDGVEFPVAPDLAVEVLSPSEPLRAVLKKVRAYLAGGWTLGLGG